MLAVGTSSALSQSRHYSCEKRSFIARNGARSSLRTINDFSPHHQPLALNPNFSSLTGTRRVVARATVVILIEFERLALRVLSCGLVSQLFRVFSTHPSSRGYCTKPPSPPPEPCPSLPGLFVPNPNFLWPRLDQHLASLLSPQTQGPLFQYPSSRVTQSDHISSFAFVGIVCTLLTGSPIHESVSYCRGFSSGLVLLHVPLSSATPRDHHLSPHRSPPSISSTHSRNSRLRLNWAFFDHHVPYRQTIKAVNTFTA
jgi:hypothetical protein